MASEFTTTTDHDEIRKWVESNNGKPACVRDTGKGDDRGVLRFNFPGALALRGSEPPAAAEGGSATAGDSIARRAGRDRGRSACSARRGGVGDMRGGSCFAN